MRNFRNLNNGAVRVGDVEELRDIIRSTNTMSEQAGAEILAEVQALASGLPVAGDGTRVPDRVLGHPLITRVLRMANSAMRRGRDSIKCEKSMHGRIALSPSLLRGSDFYLRVC